MSLLKPLFFLLISCLTSSMVFSQGFLNGSPSWQYEFSCGSIYLTTGHNEITFVKDTILQGQAMKVFHERIERISHAPPEFITTITHEKLYLYEEGERVFRYAADADTSELLYDFSLSQGDTLLTISSAKTGCGRDIYLLIDTVGQLTIGGMTLTYLDVVADTLVSSNYSSYRIVEKIGSLRSYYLLKDNFECWLDGCASGISFACYQNDSLNLAYPSFRTCEFTTGIDSKNAFFNQLTWSLLPDQRGIRIEGLDRDAQVQIQDISGRMIAYQRVGEKVLFNVSRGMYFVQVRERKGILRAGKVYLP